MTFSNSHKQGDGAVEEEMQVKLTMTPTMLENLLFATADAVRHVESELWECREDAHEHRDFLEQRLTAHYDLNAVVGHIHWGVQKRLGNKAPNFSSVSMG